MSTVTEAVTGNVTDCTLWDGALNSKGYGCVSVAGKSQLVHRVVYTHTHGPIPGGLQVDHTCHNRDSTCPGGVACLHRRCYDPDHLEAVTPLENVHRTGHGSQTHCRKGHPLSGQNLYLHTHGSRPATRALSDLPRGKRRRQVPLAPAGAPCFPKARGTRGPPSPHRKSRDPAPPDSRNRVHNERNHLMSTDTNTATTALAFHAVTAHMIDRDLPAPASIAMSVDRQSLRVHLIWPSDVTEWLDTLHVDSDAVEVIGGCVHTSYAARLPDTGVRVTIATVKLGHSLTAVPA